MKAFEFLTLTSVTSLRQNVKYSNMSLHCISSYVHHITFKIKNLKWINKYLGIFCYSCSHFLHHMVHDSKETRTFSTGTTRFIWFHFQNKNN